MKKLMLLFTVLTLSLSFMVVNIAVADSVRAKILGTWAITNETVDRTYNGTTGQVTFYDDYLTIDLGRFAASGIAAAAEDVICNIPLDPIAYKLIGKSIIYVSWQGESRGTGDLYARDATITIVEGEGTGLTLIGEGGCGVQGVPRISHLERIQ